MRKVFVSLLIAIFVGFSVFLTLLWGSYQVFSDEEFYSDELLEIFYNFTVEKLAKDLEVTEFSAVDSAKLKEIVEMSIPKSDIQFIVDSVLIQISEGEVDQQGVFAIVVPFDGILNRSNDISDNLANTLLEVLPDCSDEGMTDGQGVSTFECIPEYLPEEDFRSGVSMVINNKVLADFPPEYVFDIQLGQEIDGRLGSYFKDFFTLMFFFGLGISIVLLLLIALIIYKPKSSVLRYEGVALFSYGIVLFIVIFQFSLGETVLSNFQKENPNLTQLYTIVYERINSQLFDALVEIGLAATLIGITLFLLGFFLSRKTEEPDLNAQ